jgi:hypothetical protein
MTAASALRSDDLKGTGSKGGQKDFGVHEKRQGMTSVVQLGAKKYRAFRPGVLL